jgi:hypothetical protein
MLFTAADMLITGAAKPQPGSEMPLTDAGLPLTSASLSHPGAVMLRAIAEKPYTGIEMPPACIAATTVCPEALFLG